MAESVKVYFKNGQSIVFENVTRHYSHGEEIVICQRDHEGNARTIFPKESIAGWKVITKP